MAVKAADDADRKTPTKLCDVDAVGKTEDVAINNPQGVQPRLPWPLSPLRVAAAFLWPEVQGVWLSMRRRPPQRRGQSTRL